MRRVGSQLIFIRFGNVTFTVCVNTIIMGNSLAGRENRYIFFRKVLLFITCICFHLSYDIILSMSSSVVVNSLVQSRINKISRRV